MNPIEIFDLAVMTIFLALGLALLIICVVETVKFIRSIKVNNEKDK